MSFVARYPATPTVHTSYSLNSWQEIVASTPAAANYLHIHTGYIGSSGAYKRLGFDIGVGGAGVEVIRAKGLLTARSVDQYRAVYEYWLPINIDSGSRLSIYAYNLESSMDSLSVSVALYSIGTHNYDYVDLIGRPQLSTTVANTKGAWVEATASAAYDYEAIILATAPTSSSGISSGRNFIDIATGAVSSETIILDNLVSTTGFRLDMATPVVTGMMPVKVDSGQRVSARIQRTNTEEMYLNILGLRTPSPPIKAQLTQLVAEAAAQQAASAVNARLTQQYAEVLLKPFAPLSRMDQFLAEVAAQQAASAVTARLTQQYAEVLLAPYFPLSRMDQFLVEVAAQQAAAAVNARLTQQYAEVLLRPGTVGPLYPTNAAELNLAIGVMT